MTWTAPAVERPDGSLTAPEAELLQGYLDFYRTTLLYKCAGLTAEQLAERPSPPSNLSLLGLIRHLTKVERIWFRIHFAAERRPSRCSRPSWARTPISSSSIRLRRRRRTRV